MRDGATVYLFRFTVKHDGGYIRIVTTGSSPKAARRKVMLAEGCPLSAITRAEIKDGRKFVRFM
jgi:hypothetical protein